MKQEKKKAPIEEKIKQKAKEQLKNQNFAEPISLSKTEVMNLLQKLSIQQRELEEQNENLIQAEEKAKLNAEYFKLLYDFAPAGFYILNREGTICVLNISGAKILGNERKYLENKQFTKFISQESIAVFNLFLHKVFESNTRHTCEIQLEEKNNYSKYLHIEGIISIEFNKCLITVVDITERIRIEKALKESEEKLKFLNDFTTEMIYIQDLKSIYEFIASSIQKRFSDTIVFYISIDEQNNEVIFETVTGIENSFVTKIINLIGFNPIGRKYKLNSSYHNYIRTGKLSEYERGLSEFSSTVLSPLIAKAIEKLIGLHKIYSIGLQKDDHLYASIHFFTFNKKEITDTHFVEIFAKQAGIVLQNKMTEIALKESEEKFKQLIKNSFDTFVLLDANGIMHFVSASCERYLGYKPEELINISIFEQMLHPNDKDKTYASFQDVIKKGTGSFQYRHKHKNGGWVYLEASGSNQLNNPSINSVVFNVREITERINSEKILIESEQKYHTLLDFAPDAFFHGDTNGNFITVNNNAVELTGYSKIELLSMNMADLFSKKELEENPLRYDFLIYGDTVKNERKLTCKTGEEILVEMISKIMLDGTYQCYMRDVTYRKQAEEALIESQQEYQNLTDVSPVGIFRTRPDGYTIFINLRYSQLTGLSFDDAIGYGWLKAVHPDDRERLIANWENNIKQQQASIADYRFLKPDGSIVWVAGNAVPEIKDNKIIGFIGTITDITERKQIERTLKDSEEKFRQLAENTNEVFWLHSDNEMLYINSAFEKVFGLPCTMIYENPKIFNEVIHPDDKPIVNSFFQSEDYIEKGLFDCDYRIVRPDKSIRWINSKSYPVFDENKKIIRRVGIATDITERKQSEKIKTLLFNISQAANYAQSIDEFYNILFTNLKQVVTTDNLYIALYNKADNIVSFPFFKDVKDNPPSSRKFGNGLTEYVIKSKAPLLKEENGLREMFKKGECDQILSVAKSWLGVPLKIQDEIIGVMAIQSYTDSVKFGELEKDILLYCSEQVALVLKQKLNEELKRNVQLAEKTAQIKHQFLANMSHEMRTPMNGILGMVDFLLQTNLDEKQLDYAKTIKNSSETLLNLINDILDLSKIEAGSMKIIPNDFNIHFLLKEVMSLFKASIEQKGLKVESFYSNNLPEYIIGDKNRINQIISNLLSNAIKFTDKGTISITISKLSEIDDEEKIQLKDDANKKIKIKVEVKDSGVGISKENQANLFLSFSQIDSTYTRNYEGTGLGLAISKNLVEMMGGEIGVISDYGNGSTFWFTFETYPVSETSIKQTYKNKPNSFNYNFNIHVLLVEDKYINQKVVTLMLQNVGCKTTVANNGNEALKLFEDNNIDLVLMDIQMPIMDGVTAVKELHKRYSKLPPIIGLSANAMEGDAEKYIAEGMNDYLSKPVSAEQLYEKIIKWAIPKKEQQ